MQNPQGTQPRDGSARWSACDSWLFTEPRSLLGTCFRQTYSGHGEIMATRSDDEAEILALIHANRIAIWTNDFDAYEKCFVHAPYTTRFNASRVGGIFVRQGWEEIAERLKRQFAERPSVSPARAYETTVENLRIRIEGRMAWATFVQRYPMSITGIEGDHTTHEARVFEKHDGRWKIAFMSFLDDHADHEDRALLQLDPSGKVIWQSRRSAAALAADEDLVIRAGRLHVRDRRADQQLQAAIRWAAPLVSGLYYMFRAAMPVALVGGEGSPARIWWVIAECGRILFSIGDQGLTEQRLATAAAVYSLSPAQKRVAGHVAEGMTLGEIAAAMNIKPSTARTHLERIFDKTGVRSQPALVRLLLLASVPV
jgi:DNA-binding CsgD family transcriptional regulator